MITFITTLHIVLCFFLIVVVLLQTGKGADMGAAFGGASQTVFGATGAVSLLHKVTTVTAILFMLTSMSLAWHSARTQAGGGGLEDDIFDKEKEEAEAEAAEVEAAAEAEAEAEGRPAGIETETGTEAAPEAGAEAAPEPAPAPVE